MAHRLARRYAGRGELLDDLTQVAALALIKAVDGYDPGRENLFASPSILGALKRHFRDNMWGMRVPRSTQELARDVATATGELSQQRGRSPTPAEIADHLRVSATDVLTAFGASWIYTQPALRDRLRQPQVHHASAGVVREAITRASDHSLRQRLALAHERINQLRTENQQLRDALAHGQLRVARTDLGVEEPS